MLRFTVTILDRVCAVAGALLFSQLPLFMQYYTHQLIGHVAELQWQVSTMRHSASMVGKSLEQYIAKFTQHADAEFSLQGRMMQQVVDRWHHFSEGLQSLQQASVWEKPFLFLRNFDLSIVKTTLAAYQPAIPASMEGGIYAFIGLLAGFSFFWILKKAVTAFFSLFQHPLPRT